jgi:hypothetical protein
MWKVGFATKDKDILSFSMNEINNPSICVESGDAFQYYLASDDKYGLFKTILSRNSFEASISSQLQVSYMQHGYCECLSSSGNRCNYNSITANNLTKIQMVKSILSLTGASHTKNFYDSIYLYVGRLSPVDGNMVKGVLRNSLISQSWFSTSSALPDAFYVQLGGNLICGDGREQSTYGILTLGNISNTNSVYGKLYVGWDPSNPDITNESSWPELALQ